MNCAHILKKHALASTSAFFKTLDDSLILALQVLWSTRSAITRIPLSLFKSAASSQKSTCRIGRNKSFFLAASLSLSLFSWFITWITSTVSKIITTSNGTCVRSHQAIIQLKWTLDLTSTKTMSSKSRRYGSRLASTSASVARFASSTTREMNALMAQSVIARRACTSTLACKVSRRGSGIRLKHGSCDCLTWVTRRRKTRLKWQ